MDAGAKRKYTRLIIVPKINHQKIKIKEKGIGNFTILLAIAIEKFFFTTTHALTTNILASQ